MCSKNLALIAFMADPVSYSAATVFPVTVITSLCGRLSGWTAAAAARAFRSDKMLMALFQRTGLRPPTGHFPDNWPHQSTAGGGGGAQAAACIDAEVA